MKTYLQFTTEGNLHKWYQDSESVDKKPGWVKVISGEPCAREEGEEDETPKCVSSDKRASMTKSERISAQRRKSAADPNQPEKSGAAKPTYVPTDKPKKKMNEEKDIKGKGSGEKDACYRKVKSRYSVWPSAYASGALVKCRKVGAANWGNTSEDFASSSTRKTYSEFIAEAKKRLKMVSLKHGTSSDSAREIKKSGFKGDEVHTSTNTNTARGFGRRYDKNPSVITMLVPKKKIKEKPEKGASAVKTQGQRGTDALGRKHYSVAMDPEYASKKIVNRSGRVQKPKVPKRFR
jgi:hypothetical protein